MTMQLTQLTRARIHLLPRSTDLPSLSGFIYISLLLAGIMCGQMHFILQSSCQDLMVMLLLITVFLSQQLYCLLPLVLLLPKKQNKPAPLVVHKFVQFSLQL